MRGKKSSCIKLDVLVRLLILVTGVTMSFTLGLRI